MKNLADVFDGIRQWTSPDLIGDHGWDLLLKQVGHLPTAASNYCAFEIELNEPDPVADFAIAIMTGGMTQNSLNGSKHFLLGSQHSALARILTSRRANLFDAVWLAFDITNPDVSLPMTDMLPKVGTQPGQIALGPTDLAEILCAIADITEVERIYEVTARAIQALPEGSAVAFIGAAPGRQPKRTRLIFYKLADIAQFLIDLGWSGSISTVLETLDSVADIASRYMVALDFTVDGIMNEIGLELYPNNIETENDRALLGSWLNSKTSNWPDFIERLTDLQLSTAQKGQALLNWPCSDSVLTELGIYKLNVAINHIKISLKNDVLRAKAYVGLSFLPT